MAGASRAVQRSRVGSLPRIKFAQHKQVKVCNPHRSRRVERNLVCSVVAYAVVPTAVLEKTVEEEVALKPIPTTVENPADDPSLHNPLQRMERLSTSWFGVITEYDGVVVSDTEDYHVRAWLRLAEECGLPRPLGQQLQRLRGVRDSVVVSNIFHWTHNPVIVSRLVQRKEEIYEELTQGLQLTEVPGSRNFLERLRNYQVPIALATSSPEARVKLSLKELNLGQYFDSVVTAEDSGAPEVEYYYMIGAGNIQRPNVRCVVVGSSNKSVEGARALGMKCVVVAQDKPNWLFSGADLVVRDLSTLTFFDMKKLFGNEDLVDPPMKDEWESDL